MVLGVSVLAGATLAFAPAGDLPRVLPTEDGFYALAVARHIGLGDGITANGISIYVAAKDDPTKKELTEDTYHALWPVGPVGKPTELHLAFPILTFNFTKAPQACKALTAFMLEAEIGRAHV